MPLDMLKVLLIEDNAADADRIKELLLESVSTFFDIHHEAKLDPGLEQLEKQDFDALLLDLSLPTSSGNETFHKAKQTDPTVPIIILTTTQDMEFAANLVKKGAQDYYYKSTIDADLLNQSIRYSIERKQQELKLKRVEAKWRSILDNLPSYLFTINLKGKITFVNRVPHGKKSQVVGEHIHTLFDSKYQNLIDEVVKTVIDTKEKTSCEILGKFNSTWFNLHIGPIIDENKELNGLTVIAHDITEKKKAERQFQLQQRMNSIGTLAGGIAHDFNNILSGLMGNLSVLQQTNTLESSQDKLINDSLSLTERARSLIKQLQFLSKGFLGKIKEIDLYQIIDEVFQLLAKTTSKVIQKQIEFNPEEIVFNGNPIDLTQVFLNLGTNAVEAIQRKPEGATSGDFIRVYISKSMDRTTELGDEEEYIHVIFEDTGIGMNTETQRHAFDPLFTTRNKGQGLGLSMVYNIVTNNYDGEIEIESTINHGTKFHIFLSISKYQDVKQNGNGDEGDLIPIDQIKKKNVLIVDDEPTIINSIDIALSNLGWETLTATNGSEGIEIFEQNHQEIDLILLDLNMPVKSGKDFLLEFKDINPNVRIIIISGLSRKFIVSSFKGIEAILSKPFTINELYFKLRELYNGEE